MRFQNITSRFRFVAAVTCFVVICLFASASFAQSLHLSPTTPHGWKKTTAGKTATVFWKTGLDKDQVLTVKFYQRQVLETGQSLEMWLTARMANGKAPMGGKWADEPTVIRQTANMIEATRPFTNNGKKHLVRDWPLVSTKFTYDLRHLSAAMTQSAS